MHRLSPSLIAVFVLAVGHHAAAQDQAAGVPRARPLPSIAERTGGYQKLDGFYPLYWDEADRHAVSRDPEAQSGSAVRQRPQRRPRIERHRPRSRAARRPEARQVRARRHEDPDGPAELRLPRRQHEPRRAQGRGRRVREVGALGLHRHRRDQRPRARRPHRLPHARHARRRRQPRPAVYRFDRTRSAVYMENTKAFPKNTEIDVTTTFVTDGEAAGRGAGPGRSAAASAT